MNRIETVVITLPLAPVTKKNSMQIVRNQRNGGLMVLPSKKYRQYEKECGPWLQLRGGGAPFTLNKPVNVKCLFYMPTRRQCDLTNLLEAIDDILVKYEILADDNYHVIAGHDGSRVRYDRNNPRTEITITAMKEEDL